MLKLKYTISTSKSISISRTFWGFLSDVSQISNKCKKSTFSSEAEMKNLTKFWKLDQVDIVHPFCFFERGVTDITQEEECRKSIFSGEAEIKNLTKEIKNLTKF